jgi:hypothetical protein
MTTILAGPRQHIRSQIRGTRDHILLSEIRDSPILEVQVAVFISHRDRMSRLYPQALGPLFVASYNSQGYGGGMRSGLHTGFSTIRRIRKVLYVRNFHAKGGYRTLQQ